MFALYEGLHLIIKRGVIMLQTELNISYGVLRQEFMECLDDEVERLSKSNGIDINEIPARDSMQTAKIVLSVAVHNLKSMYSLPTPEFRATRENLKHF